jgi:hypothetical protein
VYPRIAVDYRKFPKSIISNHYVRGVL